jgi:hypothetical protein
MNSNPRSPEARFRPVAADRLPEPVRTELEAWQAARRYAAAGVRVLIDRPTVVGEFSYIVAQAVNRDLRTLVPDLLRWHLPPDAGNRGRLMAGATVVLNRYEARRDPALLARVSTGQNATAQVIEVVVAPQREAGREPVNLPRMCWDVRHTDELRAAYGGTYRIPFFNSDATPLGPDDYPGAECPADPVGRIEWLTLQWDHGQFRAALAECGIGTGTERWNPSDVPPIAVWELPDLIRRRTRRNGEGRFGVVAPWPPRHPSTPMLLVDIYKGAATARLDDCDLDAAVSRHFSIPFVTSRRPVDVDLLRFGYLRPDELHPLVHKALFPAAAPLEKGGLDGSAGC